MAYKDEEILKKREERKREQYATLEKGIYMDGKIVRFQRQTIGKGISQSISLFLPEIMEEMPEDYARVKYPSQFRPQVIMTTLDLCINMGFTFYPKKLWDGDGKKGIQGVQAALQRVYPTFRFYPCEELKEEKGWFFSYRSHALDKDLYNMSMIMPIKEGILHGIFNCPLDEEEKWRRIMVMIWNTITETEEEE